ncbi:MAG: adenylosuccinate synthase [Caldilineaceae bacterium]
MPVTAIVGANWGDEGKGKLTDYLAGQADYVVRFQGGNNAGHTIINDYGKFALHLLPSGVFYPHVVNVIGPGVAFNLRAFCTELDALHARGVPQPQIQISNRAQIVLPYHQLLDRYEEERLGAQQFGSTRQGIAPFYADKYLKLGVQVADLYDQPRLTARIERALATKNVLLATLYHQPTLNAAAIVAALAADAAVIAPYVTETLPLLHDALAQGKQVLVEGQLGALRDPDHGIYPYPSSSSPLAGFATVGAGLPPYAITRIVAVTKAYSTCVGAGPFVTELTGAVADQLRQRGGADGEYGATTGRPRRVGWFDAVATRYGCQVQGATEVALTNLDVLSYLDEIPICTAYQIEGESITHFPTTGPLERATPVLTTVPGWRTDITHVRHFQDLPANAQRYVEQVEELIATPIRWLSVGPHREAMIDRS